MYTTCIFDFMHSLTKQYKIWVFVIQQITTDEKYFSMWIAVESSVETSNVHLHIYSNFLLQSHSFISLFENWVSACGVNIRISINKWMFGYPSRKFDSLYVSIHIVLSNVQCSWQCHFSQLQRFHALESASAIMLSFPLIWVTFSPYGWRIKLHLKSLWFLFRNRSRKVNGLWSV